MLYNELAGYMLQGQHEAHSTQDHQAYSTFLPTVGKKSIFVNIYQTKLSKKICWQKHFSGGKVLHATRTLQKCHKNQFSNLHRPSNWTYSLIKKK